MLTWLAGLEMPDVSRQCGEAHRRIDAPVLVERRLAQRAKTDSTAALPVHRLADAALLTLDYLLQARNAMRAGMIAHLNTDITTTHLVSDSGSRTTAKEAVEHDVIGFGGECQNFSK